MTGKQIEKTCVQGLIKGIQKEQKLIDSKSREIHRRAAEMIEEGNERMSKGIAEVAKKIPSFEREITAKSKDIHSRAEDLIAEGNKRMKTGIEAVKDGIKEQVRENSAATKEMSNKIKHLNNKIAKYETEIIAHKRETAHYVHVFYYGEGKS
ncbi:MAG: hypothetical protein ABH850_02145 [Candidatus Micrarchaeota archaeon]